MRTFQKVKNQLFLSPHIQSSVDGCIFGQLGEPKWERGQN
jgi:hypothetical protein